MKKKKKTSLLKRQLTTKEFLSTGSTLLDLSISCNKNREGGIPTNRIVEFSGTGASGKTYICGELCGDALRKGYKVYVDDIERRWDLDRLDTFGFSSSDKRFKYINPPSSSVEDCYSRMFKRLDRAKKGDKILYIVDPIAALYAEQEKKSDKMSQSRAKAIQKNMRFLKDRVSSDSDKTISVVFSNQLIDAVGQTFGPRKVTPGGNAMIHWPSVRVRFSSPGKIYDKEDNVFKRVIGVQLHSEVIKNSEDDAFRSVEFSVLFGYGIDDITDNVVWLRDHTNVFGSSSSSWLKFPGKEKKIQGIRNFVEYIEEKNLERKLKRLVQKYYRKFYKPINRKPKAR